MTDRAETVLTDSTGRKLTLRPMDLVEQYRLAKAVGADTVKNEVAWGMAQTAAAVREIDGLPLPYPMTDQGVELNIARIGDAGYAAFIGYMQDKHAELIAAAKAAGGGGPLDSSAKSSDTPA